LTLYVPHDNQLEAMEHVYDVPRGALWMPMGGGKTVTSLTAFANLDTVEDIFPLLVLGPKRVVASTWPDEVEKWDHLSHLSMVPILGEKRLRSALLGRSAPIHAINYDNLQWLVEELGDDWPYLTVVADEVTKLKGFRLRQGSKRAQSLAKRAHTKVRRFLGLTGTPNPNGLQDLWGPTWFYDQGARLGRSYTAFEDRWFTKGWDGYSLEPQPYAEQQIQDKLRDICMTVKGLTVDEPIWADIKVKLPPKARAIYRELEDEMFAELDDGAEIDAVNAAVLTGKCHQLANGALYTVAGGAEWSVLHDEKIEALQSIMEENNGAPLLVAYNFQSDLARLLKAFPFARHLDDDPKTIRDWCAGKIKMLLAHPKSAGHGLNLQEGGHHIVYFSTTWNLEEYMQILERIGPMRQKQSGFDRPVFAYRILAENTIDEDMAERLAHKLTVQDAMLLAMQRRKT